MSTHTFKDLKREDTISNMCGVTMNDSVDSRVIAEVMGEKPGIEITHYPAMIRIDGDEKLVFDMEELSDALGKPFTPYDFELAMSTHYGRMVMVDEGTIVLFGKMEDAAQYEE